MSGWAAYIKTLTDSCSAICRAAIVGLNDGGSVWARTEGEKEFKVYSLILRILLTLRLLRRN